MIYRYGYRRIIGSVNVDLKIWLREKLFLHNYFYEMEIIESWDL